MIKRTVLALPAVLLVMAFSAPGAIAASRDREVTSSKDGQELLLLRNQRASARNMGREDDGGGDRSSGRSQRLSPEERRQLRRDIRDAGREIYPPRR